MCVKSANKKKHKPQEQRLMHPLRAEVNKHNTPKYLNTKDPPQFTLNQTHQPLFIYILNHMLTKHPLLHVVQENHCNQC